MSSDTSSLSSDVSIPSDSSVCALLKWKNPAATGKLCGSIIATLVLVKVNVVNHVFHLAYMALLAAAAAEYAGRVLTGQGFVIKYAGVPRPRSDTLRKSVLPALGDAAEAIEAKVHTVVYAQNIESTLKAAAVSYILYKLTLWFSLYSLVFASVILAFSLPPFYENNKKQIDAAVNQYTKLAKEKSSEYTALAQEKVAPHLDALVKKSGLVGTFFQSKLPMRTAGSIVGSRSYSSSALAATSPAEEPSVAVTTGASKFPDMPSHVSQTAPQSMTEAVETSAEPAF